VKSNYKVVVLVSFFLLLLLIGSSISNYIISMQATQKQLKTQSLPLSVDNIYTAIQQQIIKPSLVASMMANDTFVKDWIVNDENNTKKIQQYLESIKNQYNMMLTFLVSERTLNYYTQDGLIEKIEKGDTTDNWYYKFKNVPEHHEVNLDWNKYISNNMIMFINYKIFDKKFHYLGTTGIGIQVSYIDEMLTMFKNTYHLQVSFIDKNANIIISNKKDSQQNKNLDDVAGLKDLKDQILSNNSTIIEYKVNSKIYILNTKYIKELNVYLLVEAKLDDFIVDTKKTFYLSLSISIFLTIFVAIIIILVIKKYSKQLEKLAENDSLTNIPNRRNFIETFENFLLLSQRNKSPLSLLFIDLDDFKSINDSHGHNIGDIVLKEFALTLKKSIRQTDLFARWGGEEFVVAFIDTSSSQAIEITHKIQTNCENNMAIKSAIGRPLTLSAGIANVLERDTVDSIISRADRAMYEAKESGKNSIKIL